MLYGVWSPLRVYPPWFIMLLCLTKIRLASVNGCRHPFVLCLIFARQNARDIRGRRVPETIWRRSNTGTRTRSRPFLGCITSSSSLSFRITTDGVGYPEIRCPLDPYSTTGKREIGRNFFRFVEIHRDIPRRIMNFPWIFGILQSAQN